MDYATLSMLLDRGKSLYESLLAEASRLLRSLDTCGPQGYDEVMSRRSEFIKELQNIDNCCVNYLEGLSGEELQAARLAVDEFITLQETTIRKVLELDSMVIGIAGGRLDSLKVEMAALTRGKTALYGYEKNAMAPRRHVNNSA